MEEIVIFICSLMLFFYFIYRINNLFKGHNPEFEKEEDLKTNP